MKIITKIIIILALVEWGTPCKNLSSTYDFSLRLKPDPYAIVLLAKKLDNLDIWNTHNIFSASIFDKKSEAVICKKCKHGIHKPAKYMTALKLRLFEFNDDYITLARLIKLTPQLPIEEAIHSNWNTLASEQTFLASIKNKIEHAGIAPSKTIKLISQLSSHQTNDSQFTQHPFGYFILLLNLILLIFYHRSI